VAVDAGATGYLNDQNVTLDASQTGTVVDGPVAYTDSLWYQVRPDRGNVWLRLEALDASTAQRTN
jgi:hypothetical protein